MEINFDTQAEGLWSCAVILKLKSSNLDYTINSVYVSILLVHLEAITQ